MANEHDFQPLLEARQNHLNLIFGDTDSIDTKAVKRPSKIKLPKPNVGQIKYNF